jgi:hypothetical protein
MKTIKIEMKINSKTQYEYEKENCLQVVPIRCTNIISLNFELLLIQQLFKFFDQTCVNMRCIVLPFV